MPSPAPAASIFDPTPFTNLTLWPIIRWLPTGIVPPRLVHPAIVIPLAALLAVPALVLAAAIRRKANMATIVNALRTGLAYYLALQLLHYGFSKAFKWQFYLPEPNTLYTPFGELPPDLAYWSVLGMHRPYVVGAGILELLAAGLLLLRPTRMLGGMLATVILSHVLALNLAFEIQVGAYSAWLLSLALLLSGPLWRGLLQLGLGQSVSSLPRLEALRPPLPRYVGLKLAIVGAMLVDSLFLYASTRNFNDDLAPRPPLHGAYAIVEAPPLDSIFDGQSHRFFVHRQGYGITQSADGWQSYPLQYLDTTHIALLTPTDTLRYRHRLTGDTLRLWPLHHYDSLTLTVLPWRTLPAFRH